MQARFLLQLAKNANIAGSCRAGGVSRKTAYEWRAEDADFAAKWDSAIEDACDKLEEIAFRRASGGTNPSDTLMIFLLKAHRPKKYRDHQQVDHNGVLQIEWVNDWRGAVERPNGEEQPHEQRRNG